MRVYLTLICLTCYFISSGQTESKIDSLIIVTCKAVKDTNGESDSSRLLLVYGNFLFPFVDKFEESEREKLIEKIYYRLQRNCRDFAEILDRLDPPSEDWVKAEEKPKTNLNKKECRKFTSYKKLRYPDNGDTVSLIIYKGLWIDTFKDGTYSKLKFEWINDCEFEIEFIESNNSVRSQFSKMGDRYRYQVIDKMDDYYDLSVQVVGSDAYYLFKIFY